MGDIIYLLKEYVAMKNHYKEYNKENLFDVYYIFENEVAELNDIINIITTKINRMVLRGYEEEESSIAMVLEEEENLVNEIADVIFTTARLIKEFKLEEPLIEMMAYKYHRQLIREENNKNERLK